MTLHRISDVAAVFNGKTPARSDQRRSGHPVLKIKDVNGHGEFRGSFNSFVEAAFASRYRGKWIEGGDILILNAAHHASHVASKTYLAQRSVVGALATGEWLIIRADLSRVLPPYLAYLVQAPPVRSAIRNEVKGGHLYPTDIGQIEVVLPTLPEQRRIVDILDRAASIRRLRRQAQETVRQIIPALFVKMFGDPATNPMGWPVRPLGELLADGLQNGLYRPASDYGRGTRILRIDSFYDGRVTDLGALRRVDLDTATVQKYLLRPGDIVVNRVNSRPYLGKSAILPTMDEPVVFESNMMRLSLDVERVEPEYVIAFLQMPYARRCLVANAKDAINQSSINQQDVASLPVQVPPLRAQIAFVERTATLAHIGEQQISAESVVERSAEALQARFLG